MAIANVICVNDAVEAVCLGTKAKANEELEKLAREDYNTRYKWTYPTYEDYRQVLYWHLHAVVLVGGSDGNE